MNTSIYILTYLIVNTIGTVTSLNKHLNSRNVTGKADSLFFYTVVILTGILLWTPIKLFSRLLIRLLNY